MRGMSDGVIITITPRLTVDQGPQILVPHSASSLALVALANRILSRVCAKANANRSVCVCVCVNVNGKSTGLLTVRRAE